MAKVYDAENRGDLTASQLDLAKEFDPVDPTPWLYSSLQNLRTNRPVEALQDLRCSHTEERRSADLPLVAAARRGRRDAQRRTRARAQRARLRPAWRCATRGTRSATTRRTSPLIDCSPTATRPSRGTRIARVSELLVSQLLQPANVTPIKPQLAQQNLFIAQRAGPSHTSFDELASPVIANGLKLRASAVGGGNGIAAATTLTLAGLHDRLSYSVGHYRFATDGFRDNNDLEQEAANAFIQYRPSHDTNLQAELRSSRTEHGDLTTLLRSRVSIPPLLRRQRRRRLAATRRQAPTFAESHPARFVDRAGRRCRPLRREDLFSCMTDEEAYNVDVQDIVRIGEHDRADRLRLCRSRTRPSTSTVFAAWHRPGRRTPSTTTTGSSGSTATSPSTRRATLAITAGASFDYDRTRLGGRRRSQPEARHRLATDGEHDDSRGRLQDVVQRSDDVEPEPAAAARADSSRWLHATRLRRQRRSKRPCGGLAIEHELSPEPVRRLAGRLAAHRDARRRTAIGAESHSCQSRFANASQQAYLYWMPLEQLSFSARYERGRYSSEPVELFGYSHMTSARLPIEVRYFCTRRFDDRSTSIARAAGRRRSKRRRRPPFDPPGLTPGEDRFWVVDAFVGYRLAESPRFAVSQRRQLAGRGLPLPGYRSDESEPVSGAHDFTPIHVGLRLSATGIRSQNPDRCLASLYNFLELHIPQNNQTR